MNAAAPRPRVESAAFDGLQLADALRAGIYRVFAQTDHINRINVFPVPDGDTGTNLSMTLAAVLAALERAPPAASASSTATPPSTHAGALLVRIADAALDGARGNSGAILAQFLLGLADHASAKPTLSASDLASAATTGATYARDAVSEPREGTLLTVLREFARELAAQLRAQPDAAAHTLIAATLPHVRAALTATTDQLEALRDAHVVDAGAFGFVELLEGFAHCLSTGEIGTAATAPLHHAAAEQMADDSSFVDTVPHLQSGEPRYCTECLVVAPSDNAATEEAASANARSTDLELRRLREGLSELGSSLVVGGSKRKAKIHIHTDQPERVFELAASFGTVSGQKADDMQRQQSAAHHPKAQRVAIVTDSAADIPEALIDSLGIHVVPVRVTFGNRSYLDKVTLTPAEFYRELARNPEHPKTSQPPPGDFRRMYEFLASHYESVVSIGLSSKVSGTHQAAVNATQRMTPAADGRPPVTVIDSLNVSAGQGLITLAAAERAQAGASAAEVIATARAAASRTRSFALLGSVDYAVRGGRVPRIARTIAIALRLTLVLATQADGRVTLGGALWGRHNLIERFARFVAKRPPPPVNAGKPRYRLLVGHGDAAASAQLLAQRLAAALPGESIEFTQITEMGTALGAHGGPETLVVGVQSV